MKSNHYRRVDTPKSNQNDRSNLSNTAPEELSSSPPPPEATDSHHHHHHNGLDNAMAESLLRALFDHEGEGQQSDKNSKVITSSSSPAVDVSDDPPGNHNSHHADHGTSNADDHSSKTPLITGTTSTGTKHHQNSLFTSKQVESLLQYQSHHFHSQIKHVQHELQLEREERNKEMMLLRREMLDMRQCWQRQQREIAEVRGSRGNASRRQQEGTGDDDGQGRNASSTNGGNSTKSAKRTRRRNDSNNSNKKHLSQAAAAPSSSRTTDSSSSSAQPEHPQQHKSSKGKRSKSPSQRTPSPLTTTNNGNESSLHVDNAPQHADINRETLENLTHLIESRSEELTHLIAMLTSQESTHNSHLQESIADLETRFSEMQKQIKRQLRSLREALHEEEETVLSLATQSSSLKECITAEIEENLSFRKKLKLTMDHYSEQFKSLSEKTSSLTMQLKMMSNQVQHMERSKRDRLTKDEDLYQVYMEQASLYDQRFRTLRAHQSKLEREVKKLNLHLHGFITYLWYQRDTRRDSKSPSRTDEEHLDELIFETVRQFHATHFFQVAQHLQSTLTPIRVQAIRPQQYRIHDRNLNIILQNEKPIAKLRDRSVLLEEYLSSIFSPEHAHSGASPSRSSLNAGASSVLHHDFSSSISLGDGLSRRRSMGSDLSMPGFGGMSEYGGAGSSLAGSPSIQYAGGGGGAQAVMKSSPGTPRGSSSPGGTPTLKVDLTSPRSAPIGKLMSSESNGSPSSVKLHVDLSELNGGADVR